MILASAIKIKVKKTGKEVVLCGARHGNIFEQLQSLGFESREEFDTLGQGFIDNHNNFLTREEAYEHAKMCGQLCATIVYDRENGGGKKLMSEDLW